MAVHATSRQPARRLNMLNNRVSGPASIRGFKARGATACEREGTGERHARVPRSVAAIRAMSAAATGFRGVTVVVDGDACWVGVAWS